MAPTRSPDGRQRHILAVNNDHVVLTGAIREVDALAGHLAAMGVRVVRKPFNIDRLLDVIADALGLAAEPAADE